MSYPFYTAGFERISEEANGGIFPPLTPNEQLSDLGLDCFTDELSVFDVPVDGTCDYPDIVGKFSFK